MAVIAAAQLLDELMGRNRNVAPNEKVKEVNWEDGEYCKFFLVKFCPHDLFVNTRNDLGICPKVHDEEARKLFHKAKAINHKKLQYQEDFLRFCASMMNDVERRIVKGKQRLALNASSKETTPSTQIQKNQEQISFLNEKIEDLEAQAEQAGTAGNVEHAQGILKLCDQLKEERDVLLKQAEGSHLSTTAELAAAQEKQMEVCEVCGAFLIVGDAQQRLEDHLMGKQHMGFSRMKTAVDEITEAVRVAREMLYGGRSSDKRDREKDRGKDSRKEKEREREKEREKEKEKLRKEREYEKERDREKIKEREEKEKENERDRKARERSKTEDRTEKRDSYRDRDYHREKDKYRERDRERHRDKDKEDRRHRESSRHHRYSHHKRKN